MSRAKFTAQQLALVAGRFKTLGEPARLNILNALRSGELTVSQLADATGLGQANLSKHLHVLLDSGFVSRRKEGLYVHYALANRDVFRLCDIMCGRIDSELRAQRKLLSV